jgi:hypothetical protein
MKKTQPAKLQLHRETLRRLETVVLEKAHGGIVSTDNIFDCHTKMSNEPQFG